MKANKFKKENIIQAEAFKRMEGDDLELIGLYAADFRNIINNIESELGRVPTADELLWLVSEARGYDITKPIKEH